MCKSDLTTAKTPVNLCGVNYVNLHTPESNTYMVRQRCPEMLIQFSWKRTNLKKHITEPRNKPS